MTNDELMHYGVIGMKWGVHRGNVAQAYNKAAVKRNKLDNRVAEAKKAYDRATIKANTGVSHKYKKLQAKADKLQAKSDKKKYGLFANTNKAAKLQVKADRQQYKANKYKARYEKGAAKEGSTKARYLKAQRKAEKWAKAMDKTFKNYDVSKLSSSKINSGKDFINKNI